MKATEYMPPLDSKCKCGNESDEEFVHAPGFGTEVVDRLSLSGYYCLSGDRPLGIVCSGSSLRSGA